ncbi:hypothetical protein JCM8547_000891 [Rhodosporidiobolus lusitaniae]
MSSSASASLPVVEDVFPSVRAFKLACHRVALAGGYQLTTLSNDKHGARLACRLALNATTLTVGQGPRCALKIRASGGAAQVRMTGAELELTCDAQVREQRKEQARVWEEKKVAELEKTKCGRVGDGGARRQRVEIDGFRVERGGGNE